MKKFASSMLLALTLLNASANDASSSGFGMPNFPINRSNSCTKDAMTVTLAPDKSAVSILRKSGDFLDTQGAGKKQIKADCYIDLIYVPPRQAGTLLQIDLRGAKVKLPLSELELTVDFGQAQHRATFSRGQVLEGTPDFVRFKVGLPQTEHAKTRLRITATARSINGQDVAQIHFDSFDACFVNVDAQEGCTTLAPMPVH